MFAHPNPQIAALFDDLVNDALYLLLPVTGIMAWGWAGFVALFDQGKTVHGYFAVAVALMLAALCPQCKQRQQAVALYLLGLLTLISAVVLAYASADMLYLYLLVILVAAVLTNPRLTVALTLLVLLLMLAQGHYHQLALPALLLPGLMSLLTLITALLSSQRLYTALTWALTMAQQSQHNADSAREHRGELRRVLQTLDLAYTRLERANQSLIFAQEAAEKAYRFKSDFVANVSHELRTPLNLIVGFSEMMATAPESYGGTPVPREYRGDMLAIYRSARHLLDLINDVLDLSQIEAGRMAIHKEHVDLGTVLQEAAEIVRGLAEARRLQLLVDLPVEPLLMDLDRIRIRQVLLNLLTNAMRYTDKGWVRIGVQVEETKATITVADSGRGIAPEKLTRAFEAFDRLDEEQLQTGTGLGLAVSKKFIELHNGHMWIESTVGTGTTVAFTLPLPVQTSSLPLSPLRLTAPLRHSTGKPLVLVLHDDTRALTLLRRYVNECDFVLAESMLAAGQLLENTLPNAVLLDPLMAERWAVDGQRLGLPPSIPVITCALPSMRHAGLLMGASDYLPKPVTRADLAGALARLAQTPRTALVVDDDPHIVRLIGRMLKAIEPALRVLEAFRGDEALAIAQAQPLDVIFMDLMMPGMSGHDLLTRLGDDPTLAQIPTIVVSVRSAEQEAKPILGAVQLQRSNGFSLTELLHLLHALLVTLTQPATMAPTNAGARSAVGPD
jgi:signal transduction histidine kinase/DNA-binding response OmpR family regulator